MNTANVQLGTRSTTGRISAMNVGRNAQCQPIRAVNATAVTTSIISLTGEIAPPRTRGNSAICSVSAANATMMAITLRLRFGPDAGAGPPSHASGDPPTGVG